MKPIKLIITLLFCAFTTGVFSQPVDLNKEKYDTYRNNLKYFVVVGEGPKRSILAERRNDKGNCGPTCLTFGDGGIMQGWYVGMLATEYARLKKENKPTQQTLNELYCALLALERLDAVAGAQNNYNNNYLPPCPYYTGVPDGISVRTDGWDDADCFNNTPFYDAINGGLQNIYPSPSYNVQWSDIDNLERQFKDQSTNHDYFSIDQLTHVMMGLYLTYHYVDDGTHSVTCGSGNAQVNFEKYAANMMVRYIDKLHQWGYILHKPDGSPISATNGGWAQNFAKPFIYLHNKVSLVLNHPPKTITPTVKSLWKQTWAVLSLNPKADLYHMQLATATISDENFVYTPFTSTADAIMSASEKYNWEYFYPLLHNNLYGSSPMSDEYYCKVQNELDKAPPSNPENNGINPNDGPEGWRCHLKFTKTIEEQDSGYYTDNHGDKYLSFTAKFSGIDYMLQYNLYQLRPVQPITITKTNNFSGTLNADHIILKNNAKPYNATVIASKDIHIQPNFKTVQGLPFHAKIDPNYYCMSNYNLREGAGGTNESNNEIQTDKILNDATTESSNYLKVYPNPNNGQFTVAFTNYTSESTIELTDVFGGIIFKEKNIQQNLTFDLSNYTKGIYLLKITVNKKLSIHKIIYQ